MVAYDNPVLDLSSPRVSPSGALSKKLIILEWFW